MHRSHLHAAPSQRRGYVMLAVLVCLVVVGLGMATLAQRSLRLSTLAVERQRELQQKWGTLSCQRTLLPAAPLLFDRLQEQTPDRSSPAPSKISSSILLGGTRFDLLLADENAKLNLNHAYHHRGRAGVERIVNRIAAGMLRPPVRLYPEVKPVSPDKALVADEPLPAALQSWGQVFDIPATHHWTLPRLTSHVTLWGQGQLNVRRAADATIVEACRLVVPQGAARQLLRGFRDKPRHLADRLVQQLNVDGEEQLLLQEMLTEHSSCFSLWTTVHATRVAAQRFAVLQVDEEGVTRTTEFVF